MSAHFSVLHHHIYIDDDNYRKSPNESSNDLFVRLLAQTQIFTKEGTRIWKDDWKLFSLFLFSERIITYYSENVDSRSKLSLKSKLFIQSCVRRLRNNWILKRESKPNRSQVLCMFLEFVIKLFWVSRHVAKFESFYFVFCSKSKQIKIFNFLRNPRTLAHQSFSHSAFRRVIALKWFYSFSNWKTV